MRQKLTALFLAGLLVAFSGCMQPRRAGSSPSAPPSSEEEEIIFEWERSSSEEESASSVPEMPEMSLYDWWRDYIYDAVYPFQGSYPTLVQYDSQSIIEYCGIRMFRDAVISEAGKSAGDSILPKDKLADYTKRYFNVRLNDLDVSRLTSEDGNAILYYLPVGSDRSGENPANESLNNNDVFKLVEAAPADADGVIRLRVDRDDGQIHYFYMAPHEDGSGYYFKRIEVNHGQLPKEVEFEGEYITVDTLLGMPASGAGSLHCWGEIGGKLLLSWSSGMSGYVVLGLVDSYDLTEKRYEFQLRDGETFLSAIPQTERIVLITDQRIATRDINFEDPREVPIPEKMKQGSDGAVPDFALSSDRKKAAFVNDKGLCLYDFGTDSVRLLAEHPTPKADEDADSSSEAEPADEQGKPELMSQATFTKPAFFDNDTKLYCHTAGYEWVSGLYIYDLAENKGREMDEAYSWVNSAGGEQMTLVGNKAFAFGLSSEQSIVPHLWLDLATEETHTVELPYEIRNIVTAPSKNGLLVLGSAGESQGWQLFEMDMDTMQLNNTGFSVRGLTPQVIGGADNGRLLLTYYSLDGGGGGYLLANTGRPGNGETEAAG